MRNVQVVLSYVDGSNGPGNRRGVEVVLTPRQWRLALQIAADEGFSQTIAGSTMGGVAGVRFARALRAGMSTPPCRDPHRPFPSPVEMRREAAADPATRKKLEALIALASAARGVYVNERAAW